MLKQWRKEGEWIEYYSTVVWDTKYNTTVDRIERINRIEKLFDKLGLTYNTYHRGLMLDQYEEYKKIRSKSQTQFGYYNSGKIKNDRDLSHWIDKEQ